MTKIFIRSFMWKNKGDGKDPNDQNNNLWEWVKKKEKEAGNTTSFELTNNQTNDEIQEIINVVKKGEGELSDETRVLINILEDNIQTIQELQNHSSRNEALIRLHQNDLNDLFIQFKNMYNDEIQRIIEQHTVLDIKIQSNFEISTKELILVREQISELSMNSEFRFQQMQQTLEKYFIEHNQNMEQLKNKVELIKEQSLESINEVAQVNTVSVGTFIRSIIDNVIVLLNMLPPWLQMSGFTCLFMLLVVYGGPLLMSLRRHSAQLPSIELPIQQNIGISSNNENKVVSQAVPNIEVQRNFGILLNRLTELLRIIIQNLENHIKKHKK